MTRRTIAAMGAAAGLAWAGLGGGPARADELPTHPLPKSKDGNVVVGLCDGQTSVEVKGVREGQAMSRTQAQKVSDDLMRTWRRKNPHARWDDDADVAGKKVAQNDARGAQGPTASQGAREVARDVHAGPVPQVGTYGAYGARDEALWRASTQSFVAEGKRVFHDTKELGGTVGISCDMCHPDARNTHPETYPKYQVQLGRVALLRDMINWCLENPVRGKPLADGDPKLRALEAYILAQGKGRALDYGKH